MESKSEKDDQLDASCLPSSMFSMEWWARIGVDYQYISENICQELFPGDIIWKNVHTGQSCWDGVNHERSNSR